MMHVRSTLDWSQSNNISRSDVASITDALKHNRVFF